MTKNSESDYFFFPPPKSEYFFQQHWESELNGPSLTYIPTQNIYRTVPFIYLNTTQS